MELLMILLSPAIVMLDAGAEMVDAHAKSPFVRSKASAFFFEALGEQQLKST